MPPRRFDAMSIRMRALHDPRMALDFLESIRFPLLQHLGARIRKTVCLELHVHCEATCHAASSSPDHEGSQPALPGTRPQIALPHLRTNQKSVSSGTCLAFRGAGLRWLSISTAPVLLNHALGHTFCDVAEKKVRLQAPC